MTKCRLAKGGVCSAKGFRAAGVAAEIKYKGRNDVALIVADEPCAAAAMFTTNKVAAAPVVYDREAVKGGRIQAILANSGCANACTGEQGLKDARLSALVTAGELGIDPKHVLVASTGVIGRPLPMERLLAGTRLAKSALGRTAAHGLAAEQAVMTTDTRPKQACATTVVGGRRVTVGGMSKGSGMIEPNMATMLGFVTTDAAISPAMLRRALFRAVARSFNKLVVDGDESTNDSVFLLASGKAGNAAIVRPGADFDAFCEALDAVCVSLAKQMAADGEGATKFVTVTVRGAKSQWRSRRLPRRAGSARTRTGGACWRRSAIRGRRRSTAWPRYSTTARGRTGAARWRTPPSSRSSPRSWRSRRSRSSSTCTSAISRAPSTPATSRWTTCT